MKIEISIKSYERKEMLLSLLSEIKSFAENNPNYEVSHYIIDDCSSFSKEFVIKHKIHQTEKNYGKKHHWAIWDQDLRRLISKKDTDLFIFIPSDFSKIDFERIVEFAKDKRDERYFFNIANDGRKTCWNRRNPEKIDSHHSKVYFTDCAFFTNYKSLDSFGFYMEPVDLFRFRGNKNISSGVGQQMTDRINRLNIDIYHPEISLAFHGDHKSVMHPEERIKRPLITIGKLEIDKPIHVGIATMNGREESLKRAIKSLNNQTIKPDHIHVYHNGINPDISDRGKFHPLTQIKEDCYYFSCDDDLLYPETYIEDMIRSIQRHKCIVTHHGRILSGLNLNYYREHRGFRFYTKNRYSGYIDIAGTGVTAFDTSYFNPKSILDYDCNRMADCLFSYVAAQGNKKIFLLDHEAGYIQQLPVDTSTTCMRIESKNPQKQKEFANKIFILNH